MLQLKDIMMKSDKLKTSAKNNSVKDFEFAYFDNIDDALIEGLEQNKDFFSLLLSNDEIKKEVLGIFTEEVYKCLRGGEKAIDAYVYDLRGVRCIFKIFLLVGFFAHKAPPKFQRSAAFSLTAYLVFIICRAY